MDKAIRYRIVGRVQGVGYRVFAQREAQAQGVRGFVRNLADGSVEVLAEGDAEALDRLEWRLWEGPHQARVDEVTAEAVAPTGATDFRPS